MRTGTILRRAISGLAGLALALPVGVIAGAVVKPGAAHAASAMAGNISRAEVLARAANWYSRNPINYDDSGATKLTDVDGTGHYRPDCSGFVSMAWHASDSGGGYNTASLPNVAHAIAKTDLEPGDALIIYAVISGTLHHHAVLFEAWEADHVHFRYYSLGSDNVKHADGVANQWDNPNPLGNINGSTLDGHPLANYVAYEYDNIIDGADPQLADLNNDGRPELTGRDSTGTLWVYPHLNTTAIAPASWGPKVSLGADWGRYDRILFADLNKDGLAEIVVRDPSVDGGGLFAFPHLPNTTAIDRASWGTAVEIGTGWNIYNLIAFADLNRDGLPEVITRNPSEFNGSLIAYPHVANVTAIDGSSWTPATNIGKGWNVYSTFMLSDLNADNLPELVGIRAGDGELMAYPHKANVTAIAGDSWSDSFSIGKGWTIYDMFTAGDLDADGLPEVVARAPGTGNGALMAYPHVHGVTTIAAKSWSPAVKIGSGWNIYT